MRPTIERANVALVEVPPILSICIPTYNRAELLKSALWSVSPQIEALKGKVELVVSDNCSTDHTREIVDWAGQFGPLRYHRNEENIGAIPNLLLLADNLARGEFCWLLGDDEMLRPGAVARVVEVLETQSELDYVYVNYSADSFDQREGKFVTPDDFLAWTQTASKHLEDRRVDRWEELLADDVNCLTAMYCSVFRRSTWLKAARDLKRQELYSSVEWTYTPTVIFARTLVGKPAYAIGFPWIIVCSRETWLELKPVVLLLRFFELLDLLKKNGVEERLLEHHRRAMLTHCGMYLKEIFRGNRPPRLESFSVMKFLIKHCRYSETWRSIYFALISVPTKDEFKASLSYGLLAVIVKSLRRSLQLVNRIRKRMLASLLYRLGLTFSMPTRIDRRH